MKQRLEYIDALRGIAILGVIAVHTSQYSSPLPEWINGVVDSGKFGVQLFFLISAFTLFLSLSARQDSKSNSLQSFFLRRFFRIAPMFWCGTIFYLWREGLGPRYWLGDAPGITPANILATLTFTHGWYPYWINSITPGGWSIAVEMSFYLCVPFLYRLLKSAYSAVYFTFVTLLISVVLMAAGKQFVLITDRQLWENFLDIWLPSQLPVFGLGFVLFFVIQKLQKSLPLIQDKQKKAQLLLAISIYGAYVIQMSFISLPTNFLYTFIFFGLTLSLYIHPFSFFVNRLTTYLGKVSFSAYLTHFAILHPAQKVVGKILRETGWTMPGTVQFFLTFLVVLGATALISTITYHFIEIPGQNFGRRLISLLEKRNAEK